MADQPLKHTAAEWAAMQHRAELAGDTESAQYFASQVAAQTGAKAPAVEIPISEEESPYSPKNLFGAAVEPNIAMLTGGATTVAGGLAGLGKAAVWNPVSRLFGGEPADAADLVRKIQDMSYQPRTEGGQTAQGAISAPFQKLADLDLGGKTTDALTRLGASPELAATGGVGVDTAVQGVPQVLGGKGLAKIAPKISPRQMLANVAGRVSPKAQAAIQRPPPDPRIQTLANAGVTTTMGQRANVASGPLAPLKRQLGRAEEALTSHPLLAPWIRQRRGEAIEQHARGQVNDARALVGEPPVKDDMTIHQAVEDTGNLLEQKYRNLLGRTTGDLYQRTGTQNFIGDISDVLTEGRQKLTRASERNELGNITIEVLNKFEKGGPSMGTTDGQSLKVIQQLLAERKKAFSQGDGYQQSLVPYIERLQKSFREMVKRSNPGAAAELDRLDRAYAQHKMAQRASLSTAAIKKSGTFSPSTMMSEVRKRALKRGAEGEKLLTKGQAQGQPLAAAASEVLGNKLPDSGTPERLSVRDIAALAGQTGLTAAGMPLLYSKALQEALQKGYLTGKSPIATAAAAGLPAGASAAQRGREVFDEQTRDLLAQMGVQ